MADEPIDGVQNNTDAPAQDQVAVDTPAEQTPTSLLDMDAAPVEGEGEPQHKGDAPAEGAPEARGVAAPAERSDGLLDAARAVPGAVELPHVAFGQEPVAEADAAQDDLLADGVDQFAVLNAEESVDAAPACANVHGVCFPFGSDEARDKA